MSSDSELTFYEFPRGPDQMVLLSNTAPGPKVPHPDPDEVGYTMELLGSRLQ